MRDASADVTEAAPRRLVAGLLMTAVLNPLNSTMIAVALPAIAATFGVSGGTVTTWLVTAYLVVNIVAASPAGSLGDLIGRRRALWLGQGILAAGALLGGLSTTLPGVVAGRILMAAGGAVIIPTTMAVLRESFSPARRARVFASMGVLMGLSAAAGPVIGGILTARVGWHAIFLVNAPLLLFGWLIVRSSPMSPSPATAAGERPAWRQFDLAGMALLVLGLGAITVGLEVADWRLALVPIGALSLLAFVAWERRAVSPLIDLRLFRERHFVAGGGVMAMQNLSMYSLMFQLPFLLDGPLGIDPERAGRVLMTMMAAMVVTAPIGGRLSERIGIRSTVLIGLTAGALGLMFGLRAIEQQSLAPLFLCLGGMGISLGFAMGPVQAAALSAVPPGEGGSASGVMSTMRYLGGVVGVSLIAILLDGEGQPALLAGHRLCLWLYLAAHAAAALAAWMLPNQLPSERAEGG